MTRMLHTLRTLPLLLAVAAAPAARWIEIAESSDEDVTVMYDPITLRREGDVVTVWALYDFAPDERRRYQEARVQSQFDCRRRLSRELFSVVYDAAGQQTDRPARKGAGFKPVVPDTTGESIMIHVCAPPGTSPATPAQVI